MHARERHAYGMASVGSTLMRDAYELAAYELAACEMAYVRDMLMRCTPTMRHTYEMARVRGTPMRWPMRGARLWETCLWYGFCEKHAYERRAYERRAYERCSHKRHAYEIADGRDTP
jgi:hypothetical protein